MAEVSTEQLRPRASSHVLRPIAAAVLPPLTSFVLQSLFWSSLSPFAWVLFYPTVFISSWLGGFWPGIGATLLSTFLVWWRFLPYDVSSHPDDPTFVMTAFVFMASGVLFSVFHGRLKHANRSVAVALVASERANTALEKVVNERRIFAALIENSSDFIGIADPTGRPVYVNPAGRRMVGLAGDYPIENTEIAEYYPPQVRAFAADVIVSSMIEKGHWQGETSLRNWQTGEAIPVSDTHFMIRDPKRGEVIGMGTITRDVSDVKRAREEAEANRRLQHDNEEISRLYETARRATQARDDVLAVVAHDLRNPLGAILMHAAMLGRRGGEVERRSQKPVEAIKGAATRMNKLIQDLLDVTRMEAGQLSLDCKRAAVREMMVDVVESQRVLAVGSGVELVIEAVDPLPDVWADGDRLRQVFENLIGNAIKFTERGGRVVVAAKRGEGEVVFSVADTDGAGISAQDLPHVFDRFWQLRRGAGRGQASACRSPRASSRRIKGASGSRARPDAAAPSPSPFRPRLARQPEAGAVHAQLEGVPSRASSSPPSSQTPRHSMQMSTKISVPKLHSRRVVSLLQSGHVMVRPPGAAARRASSAVVVRPRPRSRP